MSSKLKGRRKRIEEKFMRLFGSKTPPPPRVTNNKSYKSFTDTKLVKMEKVKNTSIRSRIKFEDEDDDTKRICVDRTDDKPKKRLRLKFGDEEIIDLTDDEPKKTTVSKIKKYGCTRKDRPCPKSRKQNVVVIGVKRKLENMETTSNEKENSNNLSKETEISTDTINICLENNIRLENSKEDTIQSKENDHDRKVLGCDVSDHILQVNKRKESIKKSLVQETQFSKIPVISIVKLDFKNEYFKSKSDINVIENTKTIKNKNVWEKETINNESKSLQKFEQGMQIKKELDETNTKENGCDDFNMNEVKIKKEPLVNLITTNDNDTSPKYSESFPTSINSLLAQSREVLPHQSNSVRETVKISVKPIEKLTSQNTLSTSIPENMSDKTNTTCDPLTNVSNMGNHFLSSMEMVNENVNEDLPLVSDTATEQMCMRHIAEALICMMKEVEKFNKSMRDADKFTTPEIAHGVRDTARKQLLQNQELLLQGTLEFEYIKLNILKIFGMSNFVLKIQTITEMIAKETNVLESFKTEIFSEVLFSMCKKVREKLNTTRVTNNNNLQVQEPHDYLPQAETLSNTGPRSVPYYNTNFTRQHSFTAQDNPISTRQEIPSIHSATSVPTSTPSLLNLLQNTPNVNSLVPIQTNIAKTNDLVHINGQTNIFASNNNKLTNIHNNVQSYSHNIGQINKTYSRTSLQSNSTTMLNQNRPQETTNQLSNNLENRQHHFPSYYLSNCSGYSQQYRNTPNNYQHPYPPFSTSQQFPNTQLNFSNSTHMRQQLPSYQESMFNSLQVRGYRVNNQRDNIQVQQCGRNQVSNSAHLNPTAIPIPEEQETIFRQRANSGQQPKQYKRTSVLNTSPLNPGNIIAPVVPEEQRPISTDSGFMSPMSNGVTVELISCKCKKAICKACKCALAGVDCTTFCGCGGHASNAKRK